jgi:hypothetical protein
MKFRKVWSTAVCWFLQQAQSDFLILTSFIRRVYHCLKVLEIKYGSKSFDFSADDIFKTGKDGHRITGLSLQLFLSEDFPLMLIYARRYALMIQLFLLAEVSDGQDQNSPIASQAVIHFSFAEENGSAKDSAAIGLVPDEGKLINDPIRVESPFWNQSKKKALQLDASKQQYLEVADGADVDAPVGVTVAMFLVNLTEQADSAIHGLFAKRGMTDGKYSTNYGINFAAAGDNFQLYIHDGTEFRVATYGSKDAVPFRKLTYITATYTAGDAPGQDADTDVDDVRMQYFINGEPLVPKSATKGFINGHEAWTLDVNLAGLLNNLPLSIGRSEVAGEYTSCVIGDFRLFSRALSAKEVKKLFIEVAGANVNELIAADKSVARKVPVISSLSQPGLQTGHTTRLVINGADLSPDPSVLSPFPELRFDVVEGSTPNRLVVDVMIPAESVPGIYPLWVKSKEGTSKSFPLAIDRLPQIAIGSSVEKPATLPAAFFGSLSGGQQQLVHFTGTKGQRVVADVELKRFGGTANPVIEVKSPAGTPLKIGWGQNSLRGDVRTELILPADGIYTVELHDLTFNAPGTSPFRLKVGDLKLIDGVLPAAVLPGPVEIEPVGTGFTTGTTLSGTFATQSSSGAGSLSLGIDSGVAGSIPFVALSRGIEIVEAAPAAEGTFQMIDATFAQPTQKAVAVSGRIAMKGERDTYLLNVTSGHKLKLTLQSDSLNSTLDGELKVLGHPAGNVLALTSDQPAIGDPTLEFGVPKGIGQIQIQVRDLFGRGNARSFYRLVIEKADQPRFGLILITPVINLPEDGSAIVELQVTRSGYSGPIKLNVVDDDTIKVSPDQIPANQQGKVLLRLVRDMINPRTTNSLLRLVGESIGIDPPIKRTAIQQPGVIPPTFTDTMVVGTVPPAGLSLELSQLPTVLFRGVTSELGFVAKHHVGHPAANLPLRLVLDSTEPVRKRDPNNANSGTFPVVAIVPRWILPNESEQSSVKLSVPLEVTEPVINFVVKVEALPHAYSDRVLSTAFSQPFQAEIKNGVTPKLDDGSLAFAGEVDHKIKGVLQRTTGFAGPVEVTLVGLPAGYSVQPGTVAADQEAFELTVRGPKVGTETPIGNVKLRVTSAGSLIVPESSVSLKSIP